MSLDRRTYLGGSDVAAVLNVSPWKTAVECYLSKISETGEPPITEEKRKFFARRKRQEPVVAQMLADTYGIQVTRLSLDESPNRYTDPDLPFLAAEIDFEFLMTDEVRAHFADRKPFAAIPDGTLLNGEIKTVHPFKASEWGEPGSEEVPTHYAAQVMHGLGVTRRPAAIVAALFGLDDLICFPVMADAETIADMREACSHFWLRNVLEGVPPAPHNLEDIKLLFGKHNAQPVELDDETDELVHEIDSLRYTIKRAAEELERCQFALADYITRHWISSAQDEDDAVLLRGGAPVATWKRQRGTYLDQKKLAVDSPRLVAEYTVEHFYRVLRLKGKK